jgi:hypothetical protein
MSLGSSTVQELGAVPLDAVDVGEKTTARKGATVHGAKVGGIAGAMVPHVWRFGTASGGVCEWVEYRSIGELVDCLGQFETLTYSRGAGGDRWWGADSMGEALAFARDGWDDALPELDAVISSGISDGEAVGFSSRLDVAGGVPDVGLYLAGDPECLRTAVLAEVRRPVVQMIIPSMVSGSVSESALRTHAAALAAVTVQARAMGVGLEVLSAQCSNRRDGTSYCVTVPVADSRWSTPDGVLSFFMGHPALMRWVGFGSIDYFTTPGHRRKITGGYGGPVQGLAFKRADGSAHPWARSGGGVVVAPEPNETAGRSAESIAASLIEAVEAAR